MPKVFKKVEPVHGNKLIDWAENNGVNWELWNPEDVLMDYNAPMEIALDEWPDEQTQLSIEIEAIESAIANADQVGECHDLRLRLLALKRRLKATQ